MSTTSREQLLSFINHNHLKKENGIICFDADIHFFNPPAGDVVSEVQIISLPYEHALYIINCPDSIPEGADVYSTTWFRFTHTGDNQLEITHSDERKILSLTHKAP